MTGRDRLEVVRDLLEQRISPNEASSALAHFPWDYLEHPAVIERRHITSLLQRFLSRAIDASEVANWAEVVEVRDDIEPDKGFEDRILEIVFELANPTINGALTPERAKELLLSIVSK